METAKSFLAEQTKQGSKGKKTRPQEALAKVHVPLLAQPGVCWAPCGLCSRKCCHCTYCMNAINAASRAYTRWPAATVHNAKHSAKQ